MPLIKKIIKKKYIVGIWRATQSEYDPVSCEKIHSNYHSNFLDYKIDKRRWEIYGAKLLFNELSKKNELISKNGIPYIKNDKKHISISHTNDILVMIIADFNCGIDIETQNRDTSKIKNKFLNVSDFEHMDNKEEILKIWCMKEVLYKIKKVKTVLFNTHLSIKKQSINFLGYCHHPEFSFSCSIKIVNFENYFLAFNTDYSQ